MGFNDRFDWVRRKYGNVSDISRRVLTSDRAGVIEIFSRLQQLDKVGFTDISRRVRTSDKVGVIESFSRLQQFYKVGVSDICCRL